MKKMLCLLFTLLLSLETLPAFADNIMEDRVAEAMIQKVMQAYPEYADVELEMKYLHYSPACPEYDQPFD